MIVERAAKVYKNEGITAVFRSTLRYVLKNVFSHETYYLLKRVVADVELRPEKQIDFISELTTSAIKSNAEADEIARGFEDFRSYTMNAHRILDAGGIAFCLYIGKEVANIGWIAVTERAKNAMTDIPFHVAFDNNEAYLGYSYTVPKFRRKRLRYYGSLLRYQLMREMGIETKRSAIRTNNYAALNASNFKKGQIIYARARYLRFMGLKFWKEYPMEVPLQEVIDTMSDKNKG